MRKTLLFVFSMFCVGASAQEHFSGINTSRRVGILNAAINPAEFANLKNDHEINFFAVSANAANNKITFGDLVKGKDLEELIFTGTDAANLNGDAEIIGPGFAMKRNKWAFGITTGAKVSLNIVDIDVNLGNALVKAASDVFFDGNAPITADYNQRINATTWGEIGFSAAREIYNDEEHRFTAGATLKLIFPGAYANLSADRFSGRLYTADNTVYLTDARANVNVAYSGSLEGDFTDWKNYASFFEGGLNGFAADFGINYQWKDAEEEKTILNAGLAIKNMGSMTFKDDNNISRNYQLNISPDQSLDLSVFNGVNSLEELEERLDAVPYFEQRELNKDFRVKLPTVFTAYADVNVYNKWYVTAFTQQKLKQNYINDQIGTQNIITVTPRYSDDLLEFYTPLSHSEFAGFTAGFGFRIGGFFMGSGSIITAAISEVEQADAYIGYRLGF